VPVSGVHEATAVAAGGSHACAVLALGRLVCWGDGEATPRPVAIPPVSSVSVALGEICAVLSDGEARCWGDNKRGQNGSGRVGRETERPHVVQGIHDAVSISAAVFHNCVQLAAGGAACWGYNDYGDLGANLPPGVYPTPQDVVFGPLAPVGGEPPRAGSAPMAAGKPGPSKATPKGSGPESQALPGPLPEPEDAAEEQGAQGPPAASTPPAPPCGLPGQPSCSAQGTGSEIEATSEQPARGPRQRAERRRAGRS